MWFTPLIWANSLGQGSTEQYGMEDKTRNEYGIDDFTDHHNACFLLNIFTYKGSGSLKQYTQNIKYNFLLETLYYCLSVIILKFCKWLWTKFNF